MDFTDNRLKALAKRGPSASGDGDVESRVPGYMDKYRLRGTISSDGKLDTILRTPKGQSFHTIWNDLAPLVHWAILEDMYGDFLLVDVPGSMRDDLARVYIGPFTTHPDFDAAVMFGMIVRERTTALGRNL